MSYRLPNFVFIAFFGFLFLTSGVSSGQETVAATEGEDGSGIEEIVVTAQKRSSDLQETPVAISVLTGADLLATGTEDISGLAFQVPNLHYGEVSGLSRITIRGISNVGFTDPSTAFHVDGIYQYNPTAASSLTFYDVAQVEVLRGPQGTLFGRSATAGSINVTSNPPVHEFEAYGDMLFGSYNQIFTRGVFNIPLIEDKLAIRTSLFQNSHDGFQENLYAPNAGNDADDAKDWGLRTQLLYDVTDEISFTLRGGYHHQGGVGWGSKVQISPEYNPSGNGYPGRYLLVNDNPATSPADETVNVDPYSDAAPNPTDPRQGRHDGENFTDVDTWDVNGSVVWDFFDLPVFGDASFNLVASYKKEERTQLNDADFTEIPIIEASTKANTRDIVIDSHFISTGDENFEWLLGFFFLDARGFLDIDLDPLTLANGRGLFGPFTPFGLNIGDVVITDARIQGDEDIRTVAGYAHGSYRFLDDRLTISLGLRYNYDWKKGHVFQAQTNNGLVGCTSPEIDSRPPSQTWTGVSGDLKAVFKPSEDQMVYGSISRGYKAGNIGHAALVGGCDDPTDVDNAEAEQNWAYEIGSKNTFLDNRLRANFTGFYYDYTDLQVTGRQDNSNVTQNAEKARVWGIEVELQWMPTDELLFGVLYGYLNGRFIEYEGYDFENIGNRLPGPDGIRGNTDDIIDDGTANFSGHHLVRAPDHSATIFAQYTLDLQNRGSVIPRIQYYVSDEVFFAAANKDSDRQVSYGKLEVRVRWQDADQRLYIEAFGENLLDEDVMTTKAISSSLLGRDPRTTTVNYEEPLTWGIRLGVTW